MKIRGKLIALVVLLLLLASLGGFGLRRMQAAACVNWSSKLGMPTSRGGVAGAEIGGKLYVVGGGFGFQGFTGALEVYDPATNTWATKASLATARQYVAAAAIGGKLYAVGGGRERGIDFNTLEVYDPATNTWTTKASMPTARHAVAAAVIDGKLYAVGGSNATDNTRKLEVYDPATDTWTTKAPLPSERSHTAAAAIDGKLYVIGGVVSAGTTANFLNTLEVYDPATNTWTSKKGMPTGRSGPGAVAIDGKLYVAGGVIEATQSGVTSALEVYDPATDTWTSEAGMPTGRANLVAAAINGRLYAAGGYGSGVHVRGELEVYGLTPPSTPPTISAVGVTREQGVRAYQSQIGTRGDAEDIVDTLEVTVNGSSSATVNGVTVSGIAPWGGRVYARVGAACGATTASFTLRVTDSSCQFAEATLTVTVDPNPAPTLSYTNPHSVGTGGSLTVNPASGPSDNGSLASVAVQGKGDYTGGITVNSRGVVSLTNASPGGSFPITIRATDNCGVTTDATFTLNVVCPTITATISGGGEFCPGGSSTVSVNLIGGTAPYTVTLSGGGGTMKSSTLPITFPVSPAAATTYTVQSATDAYGCLAATSGSATVTPDNVVPVITLKGANPMTVQCATGFTDPGATATDNCAGSVPVTSSGSVNTAVPGSYTITYSARDVRGNLATMTRTVNVVDTTAPALTLKSAIQLWPPNHTYHTVTTSQMVQSVSDGCHTSLSINDVVIEKVTSNEPDDAPDDADGNTANDIVIAADRKSVQLRSERDETKNGRVYLVTLRVRDTSGNTTSRDFQVRVPLR
jgi:N-acetylneuraminic acid mutarotase